MPLHSRYPEPDEFKVDATYTCWVSRSKTGIHSKYAERIRRYKYRQGYRLTGEHLRVATSIPNPTTQANHQCLKKHKTNTFFLTIAQRKSSFILLYQHLQEWY